MFIILVQGFCPLVTRTSCGFRLKTFPFLRYRGNCDARKRSKIFGTFDKQTPVCSFTILGFSIRIYGKRPTFGSMQICVLPKSRESYLILAHFFHIPRENEISHGLLGLLNFLLCIPIDDTVKT